MSSLQEHRPGRFRIRFYFEGRSQSIYLPKITRKQAASVLEKTDRLIEARLCGELPPARVLEWLAEVGHELHDRLVSAGLTKPRKTRRSETLAEFTSEYVEERESAPATARNLQRAAKCLVDAFGADRTLDDITAGDADRFARKLKNAKATNNHMIRLAKQFFRAAQRDGLIPVSPFQDIKAGSTINKERQSFIRQETILNVMEHSPDIDTRTVLALIRFGGLRHCSETFALKIADINWTELRFRVNASKTGVRNVPIYPELLPWLEDAFDAAPDGAEYLVQCRKKSTIRSRFLVAQKAALVERWPREFHNLRSSRQTELQREFPEHVVCAWMGNSEKVARDHYLQTTDEDFERATKRATNSDPRATKRATKIPETPENSRKPAEPNDSETP